MAKVRIQKVVKLDSLGKWQQPILDAIKTELPRSRSEYTPLPTGNPGLVVLWKGFAGLDVTERQKKVRDVLSNVSVTASKRIPLIITLTPDEAAGRDSF
jgi:hypothetical protein